MLKCLVPLKKYLDQMVALFEKTAFIADDPIAIPHAFDDPRDQEVIALFAALLAWGQRKIILDKLAQLCEIMSYKPYRFVSEFNLERDSHKLSSFGHRTFLPVDAIWLTQNLSLILHQHKTLEQAFSGFVGETDDRVGNAIQGFSELMMNADPRTPKRLRKHLARPESGSACKRFCMYLRWMVRNGPVDLGLWEVLRPSDLYLPLDTHSGRLARALGMLSRNQNDWKATLELTRNCRLLTPEDPCKYDYAFFGLGAYNHPLSERFTGEGRIHVTSLTDPRSTS